MARRMYGIGSRTTENSGPIKLSRQCAMALCRALLTWLFGKSMISKTESKHCSQPCFHRGFYEDQIRPLSAGQKLKFLPLSLGWSLQHNVLGFSHLSHSLMRKIKNIFAIYNKIVGTAILKLAMVKNSSKFVKKICQKNPSKNPLKISSKKFVKKIC